MIRRAQPDEIASIPELWERTGLGIRHGEGPGSLKALLENDPGALLVAEEDGRIVGTLIAAWDGWRGNLYRLGVLSEYRGRGIAADLVRAGERHIAERGGRRVVAAVGRDNPDATEFWKAAGYEIQDAHRMVKNLSD